MRDRAAGVRRVTRVIGIAVALLAAGPAMAQEVEDLSRILDSRTFLKAATSRVRTAPEGGRYQTFENGHVYQTPEGDFFAVEGGRNPILARYEAQGGAAGRLGFPIEEPPSPGTTLYPRTQRFQQGSITALSPSDTRLTLWEVPAPAAFFIVRSETFPTTVRLSWLNKGAPETLILKQVNGGAWTTAQTYPALADGLFSQWVDNSPAVNARNCYMVVASDGFYTAATPTRCTFTRDGLSGTPYRVSRAQVRITVPASPPEWSLGTNDAVQVRLQSKAGLNLPLPTGNRTWVDSSSHDFQPGTRRTYDVMTSNITYVSDITMLSVTVPGDDDLCIEAVELFVNNRRVFRRFYGSTPTTCARTSNGTPVVAAGFDELRAYTGWPNGSSVIFDDFRGFQARELASLLEAKFANLLHDQDAHLRDGHPIHTHRIDDNTLYASLDFIAADGGIQGDLECAVDFRLVIHPSEANDGRYRIRVEEPDTHCGWDWIPLVDDLVNIAFTIVPVWHYAVDVEIEKAFANVGGANLGVPPDGFHFCFPTDTSIPISLDFVDGGFSVCVGMP